MAEAKLSKYAAKVKRRETQTLAAIDAAVKITEKQTLPTIRTPHPKPPRRNMEIGDLGELPAKCADALTRAANLLAFAETVRRRRTVKTKPKVLPYVYLDIDAEMDGEEFRYREVHIGANCSVFDSTWPSKCPFYRGYMDPPQDGEECVYGRSGECACREIRIEAVRRFKKFVDEFLAEVEEVE